MTRLYLDHNATTPLRAEAREALVEALDRGVGNPSSVHGSGREARAVVDEARERIAAALGVHEDSIVFTSGGTESNNLALFGAAAALGSATLVTSPLEHAAVRSPIAALEAAGAEVRRIANDEEGHLDLDSFAGLCAGRRPLVVSLMAANSELGTLNDLAQIRGAMGERSRDRILHCDAVQALGKTEVAATLASADLVTLSAHKVGGPVGVGVLVRQNSAPVVPRTVGGSQESDLRAGTENVAALAAAAVAIELAVREAQAFERSLRPVLRAFCSAVVRAFPHARLNGPGVDDPRRLANTANVSFPNCGDARMLVARFDLEGLELSAGSACASGSTEPSHVISALGFDDVERVRSAVRFSFGRDSTERDAHVAVEKLRITLGEAP